MELPPYQWPHWGPVLRDVRWRVRELALHSFPIILLTTSLFWFLLHSDGSGAFHALGARLEPFAAIFGLHWRLFIVLLVALVNRETALGALATFFYADASGPAITSAIGSATQTLPAANCLVDSISRPQAIAFLVAFFFNAPCCAAMAATATECRSYAWTAKLAAHYFAMALLLSGLVFRLCEFFF
jgi:ferrous iron transport protein B